MFYFANYLYNPSIYPPLFVGLLIGALGIAVIVREKRSSASLMFGLLTMLVMAWLLSYVGIFSSANRSIALQWVKIEIMIVVFIPSALYIFSLVLINRFKAHRFTAWGSLVLSIIFCLAAVAGNRFVESVYEYRWGYYAKLGFLSIPFLLFFFSMLFLSLGLFFAEQRKALSLRQKKRLHAMILAYSVGYLGSVDYLPTYGIPVYPWGYMAVLGFVLISAWAIWRYQLVDITPQFAAQKILDTMDDALLVLDAEGFVRAVNRSACHLFGLAENVFVGRPIREADREFFSPQTRESLVRTGAVADYEFKFQSSQGKRILSVSASAMRDASGQPVAFVLIARDITDFKRTEDELFQKGLDLARTTAEREQLELFAFAASHDLREPLQKIISFGDLLKMTTERLDDKAKDYVDRMQKAAFRMSELIDAILRFSRATTREEHLEKINLGEVVRDVLSDLEVKITAASAKIEVDRLPVVEVDKMQVHEVFQNLLSNSLKFVKKGEPARIRVRVGAVQNGLVEIRVEDNGVGFDPKYSEKIFKPFERLHSRSEYEGHGMGLAICQKIVLRHRGRIAVESAPGQGTTFILHLPAARPVNGTG